MKTETTLRIELQVPASYMIAQLQTYNTEIEEQVEKGIKAALDNLTKPDVMSSMIATAVTDALKTNIINNVVVPHFKETLKNKIQQKIDDKISEFAETFTKDLFGNL